MTVTQARRRRQRVRAAAGAGIVLVVGVGVIVLSGGAASAGYRTAVVSTRAVDQTVNAVATIEPVSRAAVAFPVAGTVATVDVAVGQPVTVGETLASLDPTSLMAKVHSAQATLASAQLTLQKAVDGESVGSVASIAAGGNGSSGGSGSDGSGSFQAAAFPQGGQPPTDAQLKAAEQAVLDAQKQVDADIQVAQTALARATQVCALLDNSGTPTAAGTTIAACRDALDATLTAQQTTADDQVKLATASSRLDEMLAARLAATGSGTGSGVGSGRGSSSGSGGSGSTGSSRTSAAPTAADLAAYQQNVDAATAGVSVALQALAQGTITSPIAGTVASVGIAAGTAVSSTSTADTVVVVGPGGYQLTTTVGVDDLPSVRVGQPVAIDPDGVSTSLTGKVAQVGLASSSSSSGATTYPVVIALDGPDAHLGDGALASVSIVTHSSASGLAVPTSAVTTVGTDHTVTLVDGKTTSVVTVQVGAMGPEWTAITGGLRGGEIVMLANLAEPLPGSATASSNATRNQTTRFGGGGGGFAPGGFGGFGGKSGGAN